MRGNLAHLYPHFFAQNAQHKPIMLCAFGLQTADKSFAILPAPSFKKVYFKKDLSIPSCLVVCRIFDGGQKISGAYVFQKA
jgi:hypothetical protein